MKTAVLIARNFVAIGQAGSIIFRDIAAGQESRPVKQKNFYNNGKQKKTAHSKPKGSAGQQTFFIHQKVPPRVLNIQAGKKKPGEAWLFDLPISV